MRKLPASAGSVVYLKPASDCAVQSFSRAKVAEIRVFADLLGITRYLHAVCLVQRLSLSACSESLCTSH